MNIYYAAYGSNLNKDQMSYRCPAATIHKAMVLPDYKLVFKGVADIIPSEGDQVQVMLWNITEACEKSLDIYEGYPRLYRKQYWKMLKGGKDTGDLIMAYVMNGHDIGRPSKFYYDGIYEGYTDCGLDHSDLERALKESLKARTAGYTPKRYRAPSLARSSVLR